MENAIFTGFSAAWTLTATVGRKSSYTTQRKVLAPRLTYFPLMATASCGGFPSLNTSTTKAKNILLLQSIRPKLRLSLDGSSNRSQARIREIFHRKVPSNNRHDCGHLLHVRKIRVIPRRNSS